MAKRDDETRTTGMIVRSDTDDVIEMDTSSELSESESSLLQAIVQKYLNSDFNGLPVYALRANQEADALSLIRKKLIDHVQTVNPHIKLFAPLDHEDQLRAILSLDGLSDGCLYPCPEVLRNEVDRLAYEGRPYSLELALGAPQIEHITFDVSVLEEFRNDPRYDYRVDDIHGAIYDNRNEAHEISRFGFSFDSNGHRYVAIYRRDLYSMPSKLQGWLKRYQSDEKSEIHPDYFKTTIMAEFPEGASVFDAFLEEKFQIQNICRSLGRPLLFKSEFRAYKRPDSFGFLLRLTSKEYNDFAMLLDRLMSDDISKNFFGSDVATTDEEGREKGTIRILEDWCKNYFVHHADYLSEIDEMLRTFKKVRKERSKPAHTISFNQFSPEILDRQRELIRDAYFAVKTIRVILMRLPGAQMEDVHDWFEKERIWMR
ncbi:hypothetical protein [Aureimonas sp. Leaf454]|uniref:hypothetical protein n=1 Tax=Aureimonas sp. Leaf454 TaxID=1736381 RepID=UPI000A80EE00|nr:hypothetical protein [Aureimonas sp. Leaf454]